MKKEQIIHPDGSITCKFSYDEEELTIINSAIQKITSCFEKAVKRKATKEEIEQITWVCDGAFCNGGKAELEKQVENSCKYWSTKSFTLKFRGYC